VIIPTVFSPGKEASFTLGISAEGAELKQLPEIFWKERTFGGFWKGPSAAGRILPDNKWINNPKFPFVVTTKTIAFFVLAQSEKEKAIGIGFYILRQNKGGLQPEPIAKSGFVSGREGKEQFLII
jgi:hypothetical protein